MTSIVIRQQAQMIDPDFSMCDFSFLILIFDCLRTVESPHKSILFISGILST